MERNLEEYDSLYRDEMRQRLIALKDEKFYKIMVSNRPWVKKDQIILQKPTFSAYVSVQWWSHFFFALIRE